MLLLAIRNANNTALNTIQIFRCATKIQHIIDMFEMQKEAPIVKAANIIH